MQATTSTVNNQIVCSTLMAMCDDPTRVSIGEGHRKEKLNIRIPIIVTGNDFSVLFAPLIRDGRMVCLLTFLTFFVFVFVCASALTLMSSSCRPV